jgi:ABC-type multidrug transport system fused ATPase/permease subunit
MPDAPSRRSLSKRILLVVGGFAVFTLLFVTATRLAVVGIFRGIEANRATGLSAISPFDRHSAAGDLITWGSIWVSRSAALQMRTNSFDDSVEALHRIVSAHQSSIEELRTEKESGHGRTLSCNISVPASDLEPAISHLKTLGRIDTISEAGEDSAVKLATAARHLAAAQTSLAHLQKLQHERKGELRDGITLEKEIAQANDSRAEAQRQHEELASTVAQAHIRVTLIEDYRAPIEMNCAGASLQLRNSLVEGISSIFLSVAIFLGILLEVGLPLLFWLALLFLPFRFLWRRFRRAPAAISPAQ